MVIGAGLAGLTVAVRCAEAGAKVTVLAKGIGSTHLGPGTVDVLGYAPDRVERPGEAIAALQEPHPYATIGADAVWSGVSWLRDRLADPAAPLPGYELVGDLSANHLMPTAVGAAKPTALVPCTMAAGDLRSGGAILVAGFRALKDFYPDYLADNLRRAGHDARAVTLRAAPERRADASPVAFARALDQPGWREHLATELRGHLRAGDERIALPAVLGAEDPAGVWRDLQDKLGRPVFEVPTLPPSVAGIRVYRTLRDALRRAGGRIVIGAEAVGAERANGRLTAVRAVSSQRERSYPARWVVLASGGWASGGLELDSAWQARETVFGLPLAHLPEPGGARFVPGYFDDQPMARAGVAVDAAMRPAGGDADNLLICGATVGGAVPWREKSGDGLSLATAYAAAETILEERT
ncbi:MAG: glycerol-3-phosphate dehydrogenase subunit GlpB [Solirubrobacteraceae bacterium]